eukprot:6304832-Pyramimonas_sp.AAC.1
MEQVPRHFHGGKRRPPRSHAARDQARLEEVAGSKAGERQQLRGLRGHRLNLLGQPRFAEAAAAGRRPLAPVDHRAQDCLRGRLGGDRLPQGTPHTMIMTFLSTL